MKGFKAVFYICAAVIAVICFSVLLIEDMKLQSGRGKNLQVPVETQFIYSGVVTELKTQILPGPRRMLVIRVRRIFDGIKAAAFNDVLMPMDPVYIQPVRPSVRDTVYFCFIPVYEEDHSSSRSYPVTISVGLYMHPDLVAEVLKGGTAVMVKY